MSVMTGADIWGALVRSLSAWAEVSRREPYGLVVSATRDDGRALEVEIVMTPDEWDDLMSIQGWITPAYAADHVREQILEQPEGLRYLLYYDYMLNPHATPALPPDHPRSPLHS